MLAGGIVTFEMGSFSQNLTNPGFDTVVDSSLVFTFLLGTYVPTRIPPNLCKIIGDYYISPVPPAVLPGSMVYFWCCHVCGWWPARILETKRREACHDSEDEWMDDGGIHAISATQATQGTQGTQGTRTIRPIQPIRIRIEVLTRVEKPKLRLIAHEGGEDRWHDVSGGHLTSVAYVTHLHSFSGPSMHPSS